MGDEAHRKPCRLRLLRQTGAENAMAALVGDRMRCQESHGRRLHDSVGLEEAEAHAGRHLELEVSRRRVGDRTEALDGAVDQMAASAIRSG